jgi:hypothetical protein
MHEAAKPVITEFLREVRGEPLRTPGETVRKLHVSGLTTQLGRAAASPETGF